MDMMSQNERSKLDNYPAYFLAVEYFEICCLFELISHTVQVGGCNETCTFDCIACTEYISTWNVKEKKKVDFHKGIFKKLIFYILDVNAKF